ncbi:penicillin-binding protein 1B [Wenzhouxiangella sp. XN24]|uniref:penicillin-binding protein 1B n=1 Tax=Wenzhouxiangella sp. XN24 TaxID=2713569 RepID=UPI0013ED9E0E|nr:penicillin-binding protein 1B [Wenzhouxiangella sp. XN24]NGX16823.1 penicillin-binding protein 1B [Wenzhouxiangella sp. XN24]
MTRRKPSRRARRAAARPKRGLRRWIIGAALLALVAGAGWIAWLDMRITSQFEGRRWDQPAQVFAAPVELYAGRPLGIERFTALLEAQGYRQADGSAPRAGFWWRQGNSVRLMTRAFRFAEGPRAAQVAQIDFDATGILRIRDAQGRELPFLQLDPLRIGSIFPAHGEDRMVLAPEEIPPLLAAALIAVEDRRFESHRGLDPEGIGRALLVNLRAGEVRQGGSTLTQQLVKSYFLDSRRTWRRKFTEAAMALLLERRYGKDEILTAYVNEVYMGQDGRRAIHGFGLASAFYFGKPLAELDAAEIATLVTIVRGPSFYNPWRHPERVRERRDLVLGILADQGALDPERAGAAAGRPLGLRGAASAGPAYQPAFLGLVRRQLQRDYRDDDLDSAGLVVLTTLDPLAQRSAQAAVSDGIERLRRRGEALAQVEGAAVVTRPATGEVLALVGGAHGSFDGLNRALDASRPIGSLVKPATYLAALESGRHTLASTLRDEPVTVVLEDGSTWQPENFSGEPLGPVSMARSLAESLNLPAVNLGLELGVETVARRLGRLAGTAPPPAFPSLLLGSVDYAPLDVAEIYGTIAAGGFRAPLRAVKAVLDETGTPLSRYPLEIEAVADPLAVAQLQRGLRLVFERGTARGAAARLGGRQYAGKTGTSGEFRDSWFAGFGSDTLAVVWVGRDDNAPVGLTGASGALPIWADIMAGLGASDLAPEAATGLVEAEIEYATGLLARGDCADTVVVPVPEGAALETRRDCAPRDPWTETPIERGLQWLKRALGGT